MNPIRSLKEHAVRARIGEVVANLKILHDNRILNVETLAQLNADIQSGELDKIRKAEAILLAHQPEASGEMQDVMRKAYTGVAKIGEYINNELISQMDQRPFYKKPKFWTLVLGTVALAGGGAYMYMNREYEGSSEEMA